MYPEPIPPPMFIDEDEEETPCLHCENVICSC